MCTALARPTSEGAEEVDYVVEDGWAEVAQREVFAAGSYDLNQATAGVVMRPDPILPTKLCAQRLYATW